MPWHWVSIDFSRPPVGLTGYLPARCHASEPEVVDDKTRF